MDKINLVLADDHSILRQGTAAILSAYEDINILDVASNGSDLLRLVLLHKPDLLVSDIAMPGVPVFDVIHKIKEEKLPTKVLLLTMHDSSEYIFKALEYGISGYLTKDTVKEELITAIRTISQGGEYYSQNITNSIIQAHKSKSGSSQQRSNPLNVLSAREMEVLSLIAEGLSTKEIAQKLFLSARTVSNHRSRMLQKCDVNNTVELVRLYLENRR
jgi:two-component system response regulator DegU